MILVVDADDADDAARGAGDEDLRRPQRRSARLIGVLDDDDAQLRGQPSAMQ